jgi:hypothetical protein
MYYEMVNTRALFGASANPAYSRAPAGLSRPVTESGESDLPVFPWKTTRAFRLAAFSAVAVLLVIAGYIFGSFGMMGGGQLDGAMLAPVRGAVETATMWGQIVLPGGERLIDGKGSVYRSGFVPIDDQLDVSLKYLYDEYQEGNASPDVAYWLSAGYLATGQVDAARVVCDGARVTHSDDLRLMTIDAIISYLESDNDRSETLLRHALAEHPDDPVIGINLAIVLGSAGEPEEALDILNRIRAEHEGTPFAARADSVRARIKNL